MLGIDRLKAAAGAPHAKKRLGVVQSGPALVAGPNAFPARYKGAMGCAYLDSGPGGEGAALRWVREGRREEEWRVDVGRREGGEEGGGRWW
jgi:hypothetical protein